jgi:MFS family permease
MIVTGVLALLALAFVELRVARPLVDLRLFRHHLFSVATSLYGLGSVAYLGALFLAALFFQNALGLSAIESGLATFPSALGVMAGGQLVTRVLYWRFGPRRIVTTGLVIVTTAMVLMAQVGTGTSLWLVRLIMLGLGLGIAGVFIPAQAFSMATITRAETGRASSIFNAGKQLGGAVGVALLSTVLAAGPATHGTVSLAAYHVAFLAAAGASLLAVAVALTIRDADAAATMVPRRRPRPSRARLRSLPSAPEHGVRDSAGRAGPRQ